jgi:cytochrome c553
MRRALFALAAVAITGAATAAPVSYRPPPETATLAPGPDSELAMAHCAACHSVDYITTQPRKLPQPVAFWAAEVAKMKKAYGAKFDDDEARRIVAYLAATYGR